MSVYLLVVIIKYIFTGVRTNDAHTECFCAQWTLDRLYLKIAAEGLLQHSGTKPLHREYLNTFDVRSPRLVSALMPSLYKHYTTGVVALVIAEGLSQIQSA